MTALSLALRNLTLRRWRTAMLLVGYGLGVATMIVLLSIGEALVRQASDEKLVGGGDVTVLPEGIDVEVMKTGGLGGMFFSIDHARFIYRQLLAPDRHRDVQSASPQITGKLVYVRSDSGAAVPVLAEGEIPSRTTALGSMPRMIAGNWADDSDDLLWTSPTPAQLRAEIDHFHLPPATIRGDSTWGEWHYFNLLWPGGRRWAFVSFLVGGAIPDGKWGGQMLVTLHEAGKPVRRFSDLVPAQRISFSTSSPAMSLGTSGVSLLPDGRYHVVADVSGGAGGSIRIDVVVDPDANAYFPGASIGGDAIVSGYVVPALRASATGRACIDGSCEQLEHVVAYHDHNWGVWKDVAWEWGEARAGQYSLLYGRLVTDSVREQPLFVYVVDSAGFVGLFRPRSIDYADTRTTMTSRGPINVPASARMRDSRGDDFLDIQLTIEDATATETRNNGRPGSRIRRPWFVQMKGVAQITGRIGGRPINGSGPGFFETYR